MKVGRARLLLLFTVAVVPLVPDLSLFTGYDDPKWAVLGASMLAALLLAGVAAVSRRDKVKVLLPEQLVALVILTVAAFFLAKQAPDARATLRAWAAIGTLAAAGVLASRYLMDGDAAERCFLVAGASAALASLIGVAGALGAPWTTASTFGNPSFGAEFCGPALLLVAAVFLLGRRAVALVIGIPILAYLVVTKSRADWLGLAAAVLLLGMLELADRRGWKPRPRLLTALVLGGALALPYVIQVLPLPVLGRSDTVSIRELTRKATLEIGLEHPVSGVGLEGFRDAYHEVRDPEEFRLSLRRDVGFAHNLPLSVFAEAGAPGLVFLLMFLWVTLSAGIRTLLLRPEDGIAFGALGVVVATLVSAQFSAPLRHPASALLFFVAVGILAARKPRRYVTELAGRYRKAVPVALLLVSPVALAVLLPPHLVADHRLRRARDRMVELEGGIDDETARLLERSVESEPSEDALWMLAYHSTGTGDPARALHYLEKLLDRHSGVSPHSQRGKMERARAYLADGQPNSAWAILEELVPRRPGDDVALGLRGQARAAIGKTEGALEDYLAAVKLAPLDAVPAHVRSFVRDLGRISEASLLAFLRAAENIGYHDRDRGLAILSSLGSNEALFYAALVLTHHGEYDRAMDLLRRWARPDDATRDRLEYHPGLAPLRSRADFRALMAR